MPTPVAPATPSPADLAARVLGGPSVLAPGARHAGFSIYVPTGRTSTVRVGRRPVRALAVLARRAGSTKVEQVLELTPRRGSRRRVRLASRQVAMSPSAAVAVEIGLTAAQRRLVRGARSARVLVRIGGSAPASVAFRVRLT